MRRMNQQEEGAIAVVVAVLLVVLLGMAVIAVDVGALYSERRELQNGADAAVLAVAENCAAGDSDAACDVGPQGDRVTTAQTFANHNATDGSAAVDPTPGVGVDVQYAESKATVTATSLNDGEGFVRHWFTPIFGDEDLEATQVGARSTAIWGPVSYGSIGVLPLTFSKCEYDKFEDTPGYQVIYFHQDAGECHTGPSGLDFPGGFGWLAPSADCTESTAVDEWMPVRTGEGPPQPQCGASSSLWDLLDDPDATILIPVFDDHNGLTGSNLKYHFYTYAAFKIDGYFFSNSYQRNAPCGPPQTCIAGEFTTASVIDGEVDLDAPDTGVRTVQLVLN